MEHPDDNYTNCDWCFWHNNQRIIKGTGGLGSWWASGDHPNNYIIKYGQNTEKSPGDLRRLAVTQTPVKRPSANANEKNYNYNDNCNWYVRNVSEELDGI